MVTPLVHATYVQTQAVSPFMGCSFHLLYYLLGFHSCHLTYWLSLHPHKLERVIDVFNQLIILKITAHNWAEAKVSRSWVPEIYWWTFLKKATYPNSQQHKPFHHVHEDLTDSFI